MITEKTPKNWKDLQIEVGKILSECGLKVEIEKKVSSVRGEIEIDVLAVECIEDRENVIIVECKKWKSKVPQTIIHAFRSVVSDVGANVGYVISLNGFQSGAYNVSELTNIKLLTWNEFQMLFEKKWLRKYFINFIEENYRELIDYTEDLVPTWALKLEEKDKAKMNELRVKYEKIGWLLIELKYILEIFNNNKSLSLPLNKEKRYSGIPEEILYSEGYTELLEKINKYATPAIKEFRKLKNKLKDN